MCPQLATRAVPEPLFSTRLGDPSEPTLAVALHGGWHLRPEVAARIALDRAQRRHEEDPYSAAWTDISPNRVVVLRSRFEVDMNRPPDEAVYLEPEDAWGMSLWRSPPSRGLVTRSREEHARFYATMRYVLDTLVRRNERVLVLDLHTYNCRREGPNARPADPAYNPDLNVGTGSMPERWAPVVDAFIGAAAACRVDGVPVDVRENVRFRGRYLAQWVHETYPTSACAIAVEVKKTFMDEWTGQVDLGRLWAWREVLRIGVEAGRDALRSA